MRQRTALTQRGTNGIQEYRNYLWKKDKQTDKPLNVPIDTFNHLKEGALAE